MLLQYADEVQRRHVELTVQVEPVRLRVDAEGLLLALRNLFENALKYTREGQHVHIHVHARRNDLGVMLSVADNGIGLRWNLTITSSRSFSACIATTSIQARASGWRWCARPSSGSADKSGRRAGSARAQLQYSVAEVCDGVAARGSVALRHAKATRAEN